MLQLINKPQQSKVAVIAFATYESTTDVSPPRHSHTMTFKASATATAQTIEEAKPLQSTQQPHRIFLFDEESLMEKESLDEHSQELMHSPLCSTCSQLCRPVTRQGDAGRSLL